MEQPSPSVNSSHGSINANHSLILFLELKKWKIDEYHLPFLWKFEKHFKRGHLPFTLHAYSCNAFLPPKFIVFRTYFPTHVTP